MLGFSGREALIPAREAELEREEYEEEPVPLLKFLVGRFSVDVEERGSPKAEEGRELR